MTDDINDILNRLTAEREEYPAFVEQVDTDLKLERLKRLAARQGRIMELVAEAFAAGASKRAIMRAYGTKDFNTIAKIIDAMQAHIAAVQARTVAATTPTWFEAVSRDYMYIEGIGYDVVELEDEEFLLSQVPGEGSPTEWDGLVLTPSCENDELALYNALLEVKNG